MEVSSRLKSAGKVRLAGDLEDKTYTNGVINRFNRLNRNVERPNSAYDELFSVNKATARLFGISDDYNNENNNNYKNNTNINSHKVQNSIDRSFKYENNKENLRKSRNNIREEDFDLVQDKKNSLESGRDVDEKEEPSVIKRHVRGIPDKPTLSTSLRRSETTVRPKTGVAVKPKINYLAYKIKHKKNDQLNGGAQLFAETVDYGGSSKHGGPSEHEDEDDEARVELNNFDHHAADQQRPHFSVGETAEVEPMQKSMQVFPEDRRVSIAAAAATSRRQSIFNKFRYKDSIVSTYLNSVASENDFSMPYFQLLIKNFEPVKFAEMLPPESQIVRAKVVVEKSLFSQEYSFYIESPNGRKNDILVMTTKRKKSTASIFYYIYLQKKNDGKGGNGDGLKYGKICSSFTRNKYMLIGNLRENDGEEESNNNSYKESAEYFNKLAIANLAEQLEYIDVEKDEGKKKKKKRPLNRLVPSHPQV